MYDIYFTLPNVSPSVTSRSLSLLFSGLDRHDRSAAAAGHGAGGARADGTRAVRRAVRAAADPVVQSGATGEPGARVVLSRQAAACLRLQVSQQGRGGGAGMREPRAL